MRLECAHLLSLRTFSALPNLKFNLLVLFEGTESAALNLGVVDEDIAFAVRALDEAVAFFRVKPLNGSLCPGVQSFS